MNYIKNSYIKKWVKLISNNETIKFNEYNRKDYFKLVSNIVLDNDTNNKGKQKRKTLIKFEPVISKKKFKQKNEWIYLFVINNKIVKIGGTRSGLAGRTGSYLCGHHIKERGKSGDCSKTNAFIYNTFYFYLLQGCKIEMFGYELPKTCIDIEIFNIKKEIILQTFHAYEGTFINDYYKKYTNLPVLCDNYDPNYKI